jgi:nitrile hydratase accessory protein
MRPEAPFSDPWEAQAFALAVALADKGTFEWREFSETLGAEIKAAEARGSGEAYYALWLSALARLLARKGVVSAVVLAAREAAVKQGGAVEHDPERLAVAKARMEAGFPKRSCSSKNMAGRRDSI